MEGAAEFAFQSGNRKVGAHGRSVGLESGELGAVLLGESVVEIAGHLAELHQYALHLAQGFGDLLGRF